MNSINFETPIPVRVPHIHIHIHIQYTYMHIILPLMKVLIRICQINSYIYIHNIRIVYYVYFDMDRFCRRARNELVPTFKTNFYTRLISAHFRFREKP